jgi:protein SCO1/2
MLIVSRCDRPEVIHDLSDKKFTLLNQDSTTINFPSDFKDDYLVVAFIYTYCPDICNITTANMKNISNQLETTSDVQFVEITFDPKRDTPSVLNEYMQTFKLDEQRFTMLTGDSESVNSVLNAMDIEAAISYRDTTASGKISYTMNHTDRIMVMDTQGRVRFEYPGSRVPPEHVIEDLNKIRTSWYEF